MKKHPTRPRPAQARAAWLILAALLSACGREIAYEQPAPGSYTPATWEIATDAFSEKAEGAFVSAEFFAAAQARPYLGRFFSGSDYDAAVPFVVVLGNELWRRRFGADPAVIGREIRVDGRRTIVIGVAPPGFAFPGGAALWLPRLESPAAAAPLVKVPGAIPKRSSAF
jgi:MacB-like periplasmic core domain